MTKEEAKQEIYKAFEPAFANYIITALEEGATVSDRREDKETVLDQIRAEIEQNAYPIVHGVNNHEKGMTLNGILRVIDKYKAGE
jgi:hypothetical protein